jgi:hypothetical protein
MVLMVNDDALQILLFPFIQNYTSFRVFFLHIGRQAGIITVRFSVSKICIMARNESERRTKITDKRRESGPPAEKQNTTAPARNDRTAAVPGKGMPAFPMHEKNFDLVVDGVPYSIRSIPFLFNDEPRYRVCVNGRAEHIFTWDSQANILRAIDDESSSIPSVLEEALSERLRSK